VQYTVAVITAIMTQAIATFGGRNSRLLLWGTGLIQLVIAYLAILQNGV
jgi:hypothetical protein